MITLLTGAMFGLSTYMFVVAAEKAGPVSMVIALQAYPLFATRVGNALPRQAQIAARTLLHAA